VTAIARAGIEPRCLCGWLVCVCIQMSFTIGAGPHDDYADVSQRRSSIVDKSPVAARQRTSSAQSSGQIKCPPCAGAHKAQTVTPRGPDVIQRLLSSALCSSSYRLALGIGHILVIVNVGQARRHCTQRARLAVVLPTTGCADLEPTPSGALPWIGGAEAMTVARHAEAITTASGRKHASSRVVRFASLAVRWPGFRSSPTPGPIPRCHPRGRR
jgi:hypothetical protein